MSRKHPGRFHIAIPGPTNIPERILNAMHISSEDQRNPEIPELTIPLYKDVKKLFKYDKNLIITKGNLPDTLKISSPQKIAFFHLDLNDLESEISTLELLFDRMVPGAILVLDDFGWLGYKNQCDQEKQWFEKKGYKVLEMPTGQGIVIKT